MYNEIFEIKLKLNMNGIDSENIYINIKTTTERLKEKIISKNLIINKVESKSNTKKEQINDLKMTNLFPINSINWTYKTFSTYVNNYMIECPLNSNDEEENFIQNEPNQKSYIDITNTTYQLNQRINYSKLNNSIKAEFELEEASKFWLFLHCEEKNYNYKTAIIIISRDCYGRNYISLGTFVEKSQIKNENKNINNLNYLNENTKYEFVEFKKQELIEENSVKEKIEKRKKLINENNIDNKENIEDIYEQKSVFDLNVFDDGDKIVCKIKLNEGEYINEIVGDFFYPVFESYLENSKDSENEDNIINLNMKEKDYLNNNSHGYKIRIAGSGEKCTVLSFCNELSLKNLKFDFHNRQTDCQCCEMF